MNPTATIEPGTETPLGRYRLIALLGQGGMSDVYLACTQGPRNFQKLLVVKLARFTGDPTFSTMFLEEARLAAQLSHPNVVQTYEIAEQGSRHYIVMEYLDGGVFSRLRIRSIKNGGIPLRISLSIMMQVLEGLEYAHEARGLDGRDLKIVHRDLSPSNMMVTAQGVVKILDFGIAKAADSQGFTQTGKFSGKLAYMPPEQLRGERVDARADLFSAGVVLAETALNQKFWLNANEHEIASKLGQSQLPSLDRGIEIDPELKRICEKALAPDREQRYANASDLKADLSAFLQTLGGPVSQKELAQFVRTVMEVDRARLQSLIDTQLQRLSLQTWGGETPLPDLPRLDQTPVSRSGRSGSQSKSPVNPDATVKDLMVEDSDKHISISRPLAPRRLKTPLIIGAVAAAGLVVAAIVLTRGGGSKPTAAEVAPTPPVPTTVRVEIVVSPSDAQLILDGKPLGSNPYVGTYTRDQQIHQLEIKASGYKTLAQQFAIDRDLNFRFSLEREMPAVAVTPPPPPPPEPPVDKPPPSEKPTKRSTKKVTKTTKAAPPTTTPPATTAASTPPPPPPPPVETKPTKPGLESDPYGKKTKRTLDGDVFDSGSNKPKSTIDRENPWQK